MRSLLPKITASAAVLFMLLAVLAVPSASAQEQSLYPSNGPSFPDCATLLGPSISIVGADIRVDFPHGSLNCITNVLIEVNSDTIVVYNGGAPTNDIIVVPLPSGLNPAVSHTAAVTATYSVGPVRTDITTIPGSAIASATAASGASAGTAAAGTGSTAAAIAVPAAQNLAFTGSTVNMPIAAAAALVGAGALTMLAARKREQNA